MLGKIKVGRIDFKNADVALPQSLYISSLKIINGVAFTSREIDIIACILRGRKASKIASFLSIAVKNVENRIAGIKLKLGCGSQEVIIDFIEKSGKLALLNKYYLSLLTHIAFERELKKISALQINSSSCLIVYDGEQKDKTPFIRQLEKHLSLIGIRTLTAKENHHTIPQLIDKMEVKSSKHIIACISKTNTDKALGIFNLKQLDEQEVSDLILLVSHENGVSPSATIFSEQSLNVEFIEVLEKENYYFAVFEILRRLLPTVSLQKNIAEFKKQCEPFSGFVSSVELEKNSLKSYKESDVIENAFKRAKKFLKLGSICSLIIFGIFLLNEMLPQKVFAASKNSKKDYIDSEREQLLELEEPEKNDLKILEGTEVNHGSNVNVLPKKVKILGEKLNESREKEIYNVKNVNNDLDEEGFSELHRRVKNTDIIGVKELIAQKVDIDRPTKYGRTALHIASSIGNEEMIQFLIEQGANVNSKDIFGNSHLHRAVANNRLEAVKIFLKKNSDVNAKDLRDYTPLHHASHVSLKMVQLLIENGADPFSRTNRGSLPIDHANDCGYGEIEGYLHNVMKSVENEKKGFGSLQLPEIIIAAKEGQSHIVERLFRTTEGTNLMYFPEGNALHYAVIYGHLDAIKTIIKIASTSRAMELNIDVKKIVNSRIEDTRETPLHIASKNGEVSKYKDIIELLIKNGAEINSQDKFGNTPLHNATSFVEENDDVISLLLDKGAGINAENYKKWTPLHRVCLRGHQKIAKILLKNNINTHVRSEGGWTPLLEVVTGNFSGNRSASRKELLKLLLEYDSSSRVINAREAYGETALHIATKKNQKEIVQILLEYGIDSNYKDLDGRTAKDYASDYGYDDILELFNSFQARGGF